MKKKIKKAFTLVELLVVIAILAILATVSIVGYNSFTKKAKVSNDTVLVKQMNDVLIANQQTDGNNNTMTEALEDVFGAGYDVEKLTPTTTNYNIVWDSENDQMVLLDDKKEVVFPTEKVTTKDKMFLITKTGKDFTDTKDEFAHYLTSEFTYPDTLDITTGLDAGSNTNVNDISYTGGETGKTVSIRTNGGKLVVNGPKDTINHYGASDYTNVVAVYDESYHEFGVSAYARIEKGHFVAESTAKVVNLNVASDNVKITENNGAKVNEYSKASDAIVVKVNDVEKKIDNIISEATFEEKSKNSSVLANGGIAEVDGTCFNSLQFAFDYASNNDTILIKENIDLDCTVSLKKNISITLDMNGKTITNTKDLWEQPSKDANNWSLVSVKNGGNLTITGSGSFMAKANDCYAVDVQDGSICTIENGIFNGNIHAVYVEEGTLYVKGGTYSIQQKYPNATKADEFVLNCYDKNRENGTAKIVVTGGTYDNFNPADCWAEGEHTNFLAEGYKTVKSTKSDGTTICFTVVKE
ncbi:MAG: type II secretion system protein [Candidatus Caccosoma sp.]|nr:type II secretion system protein [Candidatus Caccosoma sp.]